MHKITALSEPVSGKLKQHVLHNSLSTMSRNAYHLFSKKRYPFTLKTLAA
jgi:hypothetical protein